MTALDGIRVLDLSRVLAGPYCSMLLGDLGAEVIKVERPGRGDETRGWGPPFLGEESAYYLSVNRNKRGVAIDLKDERGLELVRELAAQSDVVLQNFRPGGAERLGLDAHSLRARTPRLVHCSITGFGSEGPDAQRTGYDALIQATGGLMSITGEPEGAPLKVGVAICDVLAGQMAANGILAALFHRERSGEGQALEVALQDALVSALVNQAQGYLASGQVPGRLGSAHPHIVPYQTFECADGHLVIACGNDGQFAALCGVLELEALATDERYATNAERVRHREQLLPRLQERLRSASAAHWESALTAARVPAGRIRDLGAVFADPQLHTRGMLVELQHPAIGAYRTPGNPLRLSATPPAYERPAPRLGEHTAEVLRELCGVTREELDALRARGAIH